jgi:hypothetical protein
MGALGSAVEDLRHNGTCASTVMVGSAARDDDRGRLHVEGASNTGD